MAAFFTVVLLTLVIDLAGKKVAHACLAQRSLSLGGLGRLGLVHTQIWAIRAFGPLPLRTLWSLWSLAAGTAVFATVILPPLGASCGLLVGGALSHLIETSRRGAICDYICLSFWPAFNLADVALVTGAVGVVRQFVWLVSSAST